MSKIIAVKLHEYKNSNSKQVSFKGMAIPLVARTINGAQDAIAQWQLLKHPQYTNIIQEAETTLLNLIPKNKEIREFNYSFLEKLTDIKEKAKFITHFRETTGFPSLIDSSKKIVEEFKRVLDATSNVLISGYDRFCSVGLKKALPGSDLDGGYAIIKSVNGNITDQTSFSNLVKGKIWNNIDNRIMSVNHCAAFPNIVTVDEIVHLMRKYHDYSKNIVNNKDTFNAYIAQRANNPYPISAAKFNIHLKNFLPTKAEKVEAKNFAYLIETARDGQIVHLDNFFAGPFQEEMEKSTFAWLSNVKQNNIMKYQYDYYDKPPKPKLVAREKLEKEFDSMNINKQYEVVKDVIRSMSEDNKNPEFKNLFEAPPNKHRLIINDILSDDIDCIFEFPKDNGEITHLFPKTEETLKRICDFNVYREN